MLSVFSEAMRNGVDPSVCLLLFTLTLLCFKISSVACLFPNHNERYNGVLPFISIVFMSALGHYTPVLPVLLLRGGRDISQGNFIKRGTLGQKVGDIEKQYYQCPTFFAKSGGH